VNNPLRHSRFILVIFWLVILISCGKPANEQRPLTSLPTSTPLSHSMQIKIFESTWNTINDNYIDPNYNGIDWNAIHKEYRGKIETGLSGPAFYGLMVDLINELGDNHSYFSPPIGIVLENNQFIDDPNYGIVGVIQIPVPGQQYSVVVTTFQGSSADEAGIRSRDRILAINGNPPVDENGEVNVSILRGPPGTFITLSVQTPGQDPRDIQVMRRSITNPVLTVPYQLLTTPNLRHIGYILVSDFDIYSDRQLLTALKTLSTDMPLNGLILDFRENDGGNLDAMSKTLSFFTAGSIGYRISRNSKKLMVVGPLEDINGSSKIPLVILAGKVTASAGEIFAGVLQDTHRAFLIGEKTSGTVGILNTYKLTVGEKLTYKTAWV
jgi:carboxyl-terminal processing protease